jgi:hypothetical protein
MEDFEVLLVERLEDLGDLQTREEKMRNSPTINDLPCSRGVPRAA